MESRFENSGPLVPRNAYTQAILKELNTVPYDPEHHNGMRNPYSRKRITCEDDYNEYVREYVYYRLCDEFLKQQYNVHLAFQTNQLKAQHKNEIIQINQQCDTQLALQSGQLEAQYKREIARINQEHDIEVSRQRRWWRIASVVLAAILAFTIFWYIPEKESAKYAEGVSAGYKDGYVAGYADSLLEESNSFTNRDASSGVTLPKPGIDIFRTVYVSRSGHKIHLNSGCSGMKYYDEMTYGEACAAGYAHCLKCF